MTTSMKIRPYKEVHDLLESIGGNMTYRPGGGTGGVWVLSLWGRITEVPVHDHNVNRLDKLYIAKVDIPKTWDDYDLDSKLVDGARWKLVALFM